MPRSSRAVSGPAIGDCPKCGSVASNWAATFMSGAKLILVPRSNCVYPGYGGSG